MERENLIPHIRAHTQVHAEEEECYRSLFVELGGRRWVKAALVQQAMAERIHGLDDTSARDIVAVVKKMVPRHSSDDGTEISWGAFVLCLRAASCVVAAGYDVDDLDFHEDLCSGVIALADLADTY